MIRRPPLRLLAIAGVALLAIVVIGGVALDRLDRAYPPPLAEASLSPEVVDRDGALLRVYAAADDRWRLPPDLDTLDPQFLAMLVAYEDKRFWSHAGVDVRALGRAALQLVLNGRIVSGASTLSMQLARLIEPREERSLGAKLRQMARAVQIERRLTKRAILERYLTLAPYGGNLEGVRAASLAWFGKEPHKLGLAEAALLVALPQSPEARRPDRHPQTARRARDRVLARMAGAGVIAAGEVERASLAPVAARRLPMPAYAAHLADAVRRDRPGERRHQLLISRSAQAGLEAVAAEGARRLGPRVSVAMILTDAQTGAVLARVGSAGYFDARRAGWIDMSVAQRSPGSTLKPFIFGLAFEEGLIMQETMMEDRPGNFSGYRPRNFDLDYQGDVTARTALQMSLNVPAIRLLDAVGPVRLVSRMRHAGAAPLLPPGETPGLAIGLGGAGMTLEGLVRLYGGLANGGRVRPLRVLADSDVAPDPASVLTPQAAWQIADILSGVAPPQGAPRLGIAYKTGTSYGYRDAWAVGYDGRHVLGVWAGRPDGGSVPGLTGYLAAAPILFEAFSRSGLGTTPLPRAPAGAVRLAASELPFPLRRFSGSGNIRAAGAPSEPAPEIVFPPPGARIDVGFAGGEGAMPLALKINGGRAPFRWLANGAPVPAASRRRTASWMPDSSGASTLTVIDAAGRTASVQVFLE
ncbi:penicillin-binding protein 1C [Nitratireductor pacificus]|uniref:peptidoglycan glycosyltransferase n=1 Tax=Nitratireductor pacificus pht-3B TaxID=391937 RepID=K2MDC3_9HYPH|nr:penicillin-binding protein 1C [Nitratireductor pacificus]EKF18785.1 penicillin-binding protein 1C [Nitratireductor pacificus pht-3B]